MSRELGACTADSNRRTKTLPGFYLSLLLPKTFCAIRSQWQRWWFNPRPTFCCPLVLRESWFSVFLNFDCTTNKRLFYTAGEYFGQLIFDVWNNKLFCSPGRKKSVSIRFLKEPLYLPTFCIDCILWLTLGWEWRLHNERTWQAIASLLKLKATIICSKLN